jgi:septal ring factor EnvC (AmiA/AmiB activator)
MTFLAIVTAAASVLTVGLLISLHSKVNRMTAQEQDLQTTLDKIKAGVATVADRLAAQAKTITDLQAQLAAGTPVSQEQLDALTAEANDIAAVLAPLATPATT